MRISKKNHGVGISYSHTCYILRQMGCVRKRPQKWPAKQDQEKRKEFKKELQILCKKKDISLWFCDETGFEADCSVRQVWCLNGEKPRIPYFGNHIRTNVIGAVKPEDGNFVSLMVPYVDTDIFQCFLDELVIHKDKDKRNIVILDNATWHKNTRLNWYDLEKIYLPAYSPDFNPIERLWLAIKNKYFSWFWTDDHDELDNHLEGALKYYHDRKEVVEKICSMRNFE